MFSLKLIFAAAVATQVTWASNLLWFEQDEVETGHRELQSGPPNPPPPPPPGPAPPAPPTPPPPPPGPQRQCPEVDADNTTGPEDKNWFMSSHYQSKNRQDKMTDLWGQLVPDPTTNNVEPAAPRYVEFPNFFTQSAFESFCRASDELFGNRVKTVHTQGVVAKVRWTPTQEAIDRGYTGIYQSGSDTIVMRLSETQNLGEYSTGLTPSIAMKFLVDNDRSYNIFAMNNFKGSNSWDFHENPMSNFVPAFSPINDPDHSATVHKKLIEGAARPYATAISDLAATENDGTKLPQIQVITPYRLEFRSEHNFTREKEYHIDLNILQSRKQVMWYDQLKRIPQGSTIYQVFAWTAPEELGGIRVKIADVDLLTPLYTSEFGDNRLFFQHDNVDRDMRYWPTSWIKANENPIFAVNANTIWGNTVPNTWPQTEDEAKAMHDQQVRDHGCPFHWLIALV